MADKNSALRDRQADDWAALWNGGFLDFLDASSNALAIIDFKAVAFLGAAAGAVTLIGADGTTAVGAANKLETVGLAAAGAGTNIASARLRSSDDTYVIDGLTVGTDPLTFQVAVVNVSVAENQPVSVTAFSYTSPATL